MVTSCDHLSAALPVKLAPPTDMIKPMHQDLKNIQVATEHDLNNVIAAAIFAKETIPKDTPVKAGIGKYGLMQPNWYAMSHEAIPILKGYEEDGCPVDCGPNWSCERITDAIRCGSHKSAYLPGAVEFLQKETDEKVKNGYARVVRWKDIKDNIPLLLKISPGRNGTP